MIGQQQIESFSREHLTRAKSGGIKAPMQVVPPAGGVRVLPQTPTAASQEETDSPSFPTMPNTESKDI